MKKLTIITRLCNCANRSHFQSPCPKCKNLPKVKKMISMVPPTIITSLKKK